MANFDPIDFFYIGRSVRRLLMFPLWFCWFVFLSCFFLVSTSAKPPSLIKTLDFLVLLDLYDHTSTALRSFGCAAAGCHSTRVSFSESRSATEAPRAGAIDISYILAAHTTCACGILDRHPSAGIEGQILSPVRKRTSTYLWSSRRGPAQALL